MLLNKVKIIQALIFFTLCSPVFSSERFVLPMESIGDLSNFIVVKMNKSDKDYYFLLDTGASASIIDPSTIRELYGYDIPPSEKMEISITDDFYVAGQLKTISFFVYDMRYVKERIDVDGILGYSFLKNYTVIFDYINRTVTFSDVRLKEGAESLNFVNGLPIVNVSLDNTPCKALIDTGSRSSIDIVDKNFKMQNKSYSFLGEAGSTLFGPMTNKRVAFVDKFTLLSETLTKVKANLIDFPNYNSIYGYHIVIGNEILNFGVLSIDFVEKKILLEKKDNSAQMIQKLFPFEISFIHGEAFISMIHEDSFFLKQFLGRKISEINGIKIKSFIDFRNVTERFDELLVSLIADDQKDEATFSTTYLEKRKQ